MDRRVLPVRQRLAIDLGRAREQTVVELDVALAEHLERRAAGSRRARRPPTGGRRRRAGATRRCRPSRPVLGSGGLLRRRGLRRSGGGDGAGCSGRGSGTQREAEPDSNGLVHDASVPLLEIVDDRAADLLLHPLRALLLLPCSSCVRADPLLLGLVALLLRASFGRALRRASRSPARLASAASSSLRSSSRGRPARPRAGCRRPASPATTCSFSVSAARRSCSLRWTSASCFSTSPFCFSASARCATASCRCCSASIWRRRPGALRAAPRSATSGSSRGAPSPRPRSRRGATKPAITAVRRLRALRGLEGDDLLEERLLDVGQRALVALAELLRLVGGLAAPQQAGVAALGLPLAGRGAQLIDERGVVLVLVEPAPQRRPALDQRLVDDLDRRALAALERSGRRAGARRPSDRRGAGPRRPRATARAARPSARSRACARA